MKKVLLGLCALVLLGAGCAPMGAPTGDWYLTFDLPNEWVMVRHYQPTSEVFPLEEGVTRDLADVVIQSSSMSVFSDDREVTEESLGEGVVMEDIVFEDYTYIRVLKLDARRVVPSEAEDLGNGFSKLDDETYYLETDEGKYQFLVAQDGQDLSEAEEVILSAQETKE